MPTGKNFSCNNAGGKRRAADFYETPYSLTWLLLDSVQLRGKPVLEPACGQGAIVRVLRSHGYDVQHYDTEVDFFSESSNYETIVTNPPYSKAFQFIEKAKQVSKNFFFLLPLAYLHGKERHDKIYMDNSYPLREVFVFTRYPMLGDPLREDGKHRTGMMVYAWFWWDCAHKGSPTISWLDNHQFVLNKKDV